MVIAVGKSISICRISPGVAFIDPEASRVGVEAGRRGHAHPQLRLLS